MLFSRRFALAAGFATMTPLDAACAQDGVTDATAALRERVSVKKQGTGAAIAIVRPDTMSFATYGARGLNDPRPLTVESVFQIASLTKIFTGLLLADAVRREEVALDEPVAQLIDARAPSFQGREITLLDLATHTSGLPRRPASRRVWRNQRNPYAGHSKSDLHSDLERATLSRAPGAAYEYSNIGYALLGEALCRRTGLDYAALLQSRILDPLGLHETTLSLNAAMRSRLVQGHDSEFNPAVPWDVGALAPAGGLFSTLSDMGPWG
jgi:CubicO group peptidase (beta-lactamase class C family)